MVLTFQTFLAALPPVVPSRRLSNKSVRLLLSTWKDFAKTGLAKPTGDVVVHMKDKRTVGVIREDSERGLVELAEPIGVILYTNQTFTDITRAPSWSGALNDGGVFVNAEQFRCATPERHKFHHDRWVTRVRELGAGDRDLTAALERMKFDRAATLEDQLEWLRAAGFRDIDCAYKNLIFAVYCGLK